ncbi:hypothetical protein [Lyngbya aestuarii]|uniref:hypothetical protein n=1 Tax=Lyngbya aestuarii TaxID=118322 RepID=UPI00403E346C
MTTTILSTTTYNAVGNVSGTANLTPQAQTAVDLASGVLPFQIPPNPIAFPGSFPELGPNAGNFNTTFTLPNDPAQYEDGQIEVNLDIVGAAIGFSPEADLSDTINAVAAENGVGVIIDPTTDQALTAAGVQSVRQGLELVNDVFDFDLVGTGTLTTPTGSTPLNFEYIQTDSVDTSYLRVYGYDPLVVGGLDDGASTLALNGDFTVDVLPGQVLAFAQALEATQTPGFPAVGGTVGEVVTIGRDQSLFTPDPITGVEEFQLATGNAMLNATLTPVA